MTTLLAFLEARRVTDANWNITGMSKHVGKYRIADDEYGDFLLIYTLDDSSKSCSVVFVRSGTHSELFT